MASDTLMTPNLAHFCLTTSCIIFVCWLSKPIKADYSHLQCSCLLSPLLSLIQDGNHLNCQIFTVPQNLSKIHHNPSPGLKNYPFSKIITQPVLNLFFILIYIKDQILLLSHSIPWVVHSCQWYKLWMQTAGYHFQLYSSWLKIHICKITSKQYNIIMYRNWAQAIQVHIFLRHNSW